MTIGRGVGLANDSDEVMALEARFEEASAASSRYRRLSTIAMLLALVFVASVVILTLGSLSDLSLMPLSTKIALLLSVSSAMLAFSFWWANKATAELDSLYQEWMGAVLRSVHRKLDDLDRKLDHPDK